MMKWENTYLVFEVSKGPKVIIETLDTYGNDGWECCSQWLEPCWGSGLRRSALPDTEGPGDRTRLVSIAP